MAQVNLQSLGGKAVAQLNSDNQNLILTDPGILSYDSGYYIAGLNRWRRCRHICVTRTRAAYEKYIIPILLGSRFIDFRYGVNVGGTVTWQPWETHYIVGVDADTQSLNGTGAGYSFVIETADLIYPLRFTRRIASRKGLLSDHVNQIAANVEPSLPTNSPLRTLIEPTALHHNLIQRGETDYDFMLERVLPLATNVQGNADYAFYSIGDTLHFHTRGYAPGCTVHTLQYNIGITGVFDLHHIDDGGAENITGLFGITTIAYDPLLGQTTQKPSNPSAVKILSNTQVSTNQTVPWVIGRHVGQNMAQSEFDVCQSQYETARSLGFGIRFKVANYPALRIGDLINLQLPTSNNPMAGLYHVVATTTELSGTTATITVTARRGEMLSGQPTANTSLVPSQVQTASDATLFGQPAQGIQIPITTTSLPPTGANVVTISQPNG